MKLWGITIQVKKLAEEAAELAVAAHHFERGAPVDRDHLFEEIADVEIVIEGIRAHFGSAAIDTHRLSKLTRLERRLDVATPRPPAGGALARGRSRRGIGVRIGEERFSSISLAAEYLGKATSELSRRLKDGKGMCVVKGVVIKYEATA